MKRTLIAMALVLIWTPVWAQVPVDGAAGATLPQLKDTPTLVTVVLKAGARDANLRVADLHGDSVVVLTEQGERYTYLFSAIERIIVQNGVVEVRQAETPSERFLTQEEEMIMSAAWQQAKVLFDGANDNQPIKMSAASVLLTARDNRWSPQALEARQQALEYLQSFLKTDDLQIAIDAATALYLGGETDIDRAVIERAVASGNRYLRVAGARLAGLLDYKAVQGPLRDYSNHRLDDVNAAANVALARMGAPKDVDALVADIKGLSEERAAAAVTALSIIGGDKVKQACWDELQKMEGMTGRWLPFVRVLYNLEDSRAIELLKTQGMEHRVYQKEAGILLTQRNDWEATQWLMRRLDERADPNLENLTYRARAVVALFQGGQPTAITEMQRLLRTQPSEVIAPGMEERARQQVVDALNIALLRLMAETGNSRLLLVVQPVLQRTNRVITAEAVQAAFAMADTAYRDRLVSIWGN